MTKMKFNDAQSQGEALTPEEMKEVTGNTMMENGSGSGSGSAYGGTQIYAGEEDISFTHYGHITFRLHVTWTQGSISGNPVYANISATCEDVTVSLPFIGHDKPIISAVTWGALRQVNGTISYSYTKILENSDGKVILNGMGEPETETVHRIRSFSEPLNNVVEIPQAPDN